MGSGRKSFKMLWRRIGILGWPVIIGGPHKGVMVEMYVKLITFHFLFRVEDTTSFLFVT